MAKPSRKRPVRARRPEPMRLRPEAIRVMATAAEKDEMRRAAAQAGIPLTVWLRALGLREARRLIKQS